MSWRSLNFTLASLALMVTSVWLAAMVPPDAWMPAGATILAFTWFWNSGDY